MNLRRQLMGAASAGVLTAPFAALAQQPNVPAAPAGAPGKIWRVGILALSARPANIGSPYAGAFAQGMRELGYVEGKNLVIENRFADNDVTRLPGLAAELARLNPDVLVTSADPAALALKKATSAIPIVFSTAGDPIDLGLVKSLARPGGNITGISNLNSELGPKRLQFLLEISPKLSRVAVLFSPNTPGAIKTVEGIQMAAAKRRCGIGGALCAVPAAARADRGIGNEIPTAKHDAGQGLSGRWLPAELRLQHCRLDTAHRDSCGQDFQGRQASRSAGGAADPV